MRLTPYEYGLSVPQGGLKITRPEGEQVLASCQVALGMILTHGCEMDKDSKHRQVALIRPLDLVQPEYKGFIRENKNFSYCYLPAYGEIMGESYVDFRRVTTVHPDLLKDLERIASLTDEAANAVQTLLIRFTTRRDIELDALEKGHKAFRAAAISIVAARFSGLEQLAKEIVETIKDLDQLQMLVVELGIVSSQEHAKQFLLSCVSDA
jgi:hypothetical protein